MLALLPLLHFLVAAMLAAGLNWLSLRSWRRSRGQHWTERARILYPVRTSAAGNLFLIPAVCAAAQAILFPELPVTSLWLALAALPGAILGTYPMDRELFPNFGFRAWLHEVGATWILRASRTALFLTALILMPAEWDWRGPALALGVVGLQTWMVWGGGLWLARKLGLIIAPPERLLAIVDDLAQRLHIPLPRAWVLRGVACNAGALPQTRTLFVTERLLEALSDEELSAVCTHEFAHLTESRWVLVRRYLSTLALVPCLFIRPVFHRFDLPGLAVLWVAVWLIGWATRTFARRMEQRADSIALAHEGPESGAYARGLARLYECNQIPAVMPGKRQIHPHLYDRLLAAGVTPDFSRPNAPARRSWSGWLLAALMFGMVMVGTHRHAVRGAGPRLPKRGPRIQESQEPVPVEKSADRR
ncbi:MAG: hypothetical protein QOE70_3584 [Chthoniobacter sp.]|nr:hypothetical protein [Chthoniobacter sp.]